LQLRLNKLSNIETQFEELIKNFDILIKQIWQNGIMTNIELLNRVFDHLDQIQNEEKLKHLGLSLSHSYVEKGDLTHIQQKYEALTIDDPLYKKKKTIFKSIVAGIDNKSFITHAHT